MMGSKVIQRNHDYLTTLITVNEKEEVGLTAFIDTHSKKVY